MFFIRRKLLADILKGIKRHAVKISVPFASYVEQKYGKPLIAVIIAWPENSDVTL